MAIKLLIVEDNKSQIQLYEDAIDEFNTNTDIEIIANICETLENGLDVIENKQFDAAIVDLRLTGTDVGNASGNTIILRIVGSIRIPVYIVSGNLQDLDPSIQKNYFIKLIGRDTQEKTDILKDISKTYKTGITNILGNKGLIEVYLNKIFWDHLCKGMDYWADLGVSSPEVEKYLLRYVISHLGEYLNQNNDGADEICDPAEVYILPPIKTRFSSGDILKETSSGATYVLMTPACDTVIRVPGQLGSRKARYFLLVKILEMKLLTDLAGKPNGSQQKTDLALNYVKNNKGSEYHFLPEFNVMSASVIDFQDVKSVPCGDVESDFTRICSIATSFYKDITSRFSTYYARQGQPEMDFNKLAKDIAK